MKSATKQRDKIRERMRAKRLREIRLDVSEDRLRCKAAGIQLEIALPEKLTKLELSSPIPSWYARSPSQLIWPRALTTLRVPGLPRITGWNWPQGLRTMQLIPFEMPLTGFDSPPNLTRLAVDWRFNQSFAGIKWPKSLVDFDLRNGYDPTSTRYDYETMSHCLFAQPLDGDCWPPSLTRIELWVWNCSVRGVTWPEALTRLSMGTMLSRHQQDETAESAANSRVDARIRLASRRLRAASLTDCTVAQWSLPSGAEISPFEAAPSLKSSR